MQELQTKMVDQLGKSQASSLDLQARVKLTSNQYESWDLQNQYSIDLSAAYDEHNTSVNDINKQDKNGNYEIADAQKLQELLNQAHELYEAQKFEITEKYSQKAKELAITQTSEQLSAYGTMFGGMADLVKGYAVNQVLPIKHY